jgi:hypothetical protein
MKSKNPLHFFEKKKTWNKKTRILKQYAEFSLVKDKTNFQTRIPFVKMFSQTLVIKIQLFFN